MELSNWTGAVSSLRSGSHVFTCTVDQYQDRQSLISQLILSITNSFLSRICMLTVCVEDREIGVKLSAEPIESRSRWVSGVLPAPGLVCIGK